MIKPSHWSCVHQLRDSEKSAISTYINYQSPILIFCCNRSLLLLVTIPLFISYPCRGGVQDTATALRSWSLPMLATCNICWKRGLVACDMFHPWNIEFYPTTHGHWCGNPEIGVIYTFYHPFNIHSTGIIPSIQLVAPRHGALWKTEVFWKIARRPRGLRLFTFRPWSGFSREKFHRKHPETILVFLWNIRVPT